MGFVREPCWFIFGQLDLYFAVNVGAGVNAVANFSGLNVVLLRSRKVDLLPNYLLGPAHWGMRLPAEGLVAVRGRCSMV